MANNPVTDDVVDVLLAQHALVRRLLTAVAAGGARAEDEFCELRRRIAVHETAEEEIVYPVLRATGAEGRRIADDRTAEEAEGIKVLAKLESMAVGSSEFSAVFETFRVAVLDHAGHEEELVFPLLRSSQDAKQLRSMARALDVAERAAPTHAHPHSPTSAIGNLITGPALAIMDHVRDALHRS